VLYDDIPDPNVFNVFGSLCFASTLQAHRTKLQPKARKTVFLGYKSGFKGYVLLDFMTIPSLSPEMLYFMNTFSHIFLLLLLPSHHGHIFLHPQIMIFIHLLLMTPLTSLHPL